MITSPNYIKKTAMSTKTGNVIDQDPLVKNIANKALICNHQLIQEVLIQMPTLINEDVSFQIHIAATKAEPGAYICSNYRRR